MQHSVNFFTLTLFLSLTAIQPALSMQPASKSKPASIRVDSLNGLINVFLDCDDCDRDYIRREITFVNYVRDRSQAQIHLFITDERTGSGGRRYTLSFLGLDSLENSRQVLTFTSNEEDTADQVRRGLTESIKRGLFPFLLHTPIGDQLTVSFDGQEEEGFDRPVYDPWNNWVFEIYAGGYVEEEASQGRLDVRYGVYARRVTDQWRILARPYFNHNIRRFETSDEMIRSITRRHGFDGYLIKSINDHWSAGVFCDMLSSTISNMDLRLELAPAIEYSLFPYALSSRKEITFRYQLLGGYYNYIEETLFDQEEEYLYRHAIATTMRFEQPWGSLFTVMEGSHYLHDFKKNRVEFYGRIQLRVAKGLDLDVSAGLEIIHDQLFLPKGDASLDEVLLQRKQLATTFEVNGRIGFSYTFGSIYNNVVNTRL